MRAQASGITGNPDGHAELLFAPSLGGGNNCLNVAKLDGVSFWIKRAAGSNTSHWIEVITPERQPATGTPGGDCDWYKSTCIRPSAPIHVTEAWTQQVIRWSDLNLLGFGDRIQGLVFTSSGPTLDVSIDEIALFAGAPP
jgi:hypothetical protein